MACAAVMSAASSQLGSCSRARWSAALRRAAGRAAPGLRLGGGRRRGRLRARAARRGALRAGRPGRGAAGGARLGTAGTGAFLALRATEPAVEPAGAHGGRSALASAGPADADPRDAVRGVLFGTVEVSMVAFAEERGSGGGGGVLLALVAGGSAAAGLVYGTLHWRGIGPPALPARRRVPRGRAAAAAARPERRLDGAGGAARRLRDQPDAHRGVRARRGARPGRRRAPRASAGSTPGSASASRPASPSSGAVADGAGARTAFLVALGGALAAGAVALVGRGDAHADARAGRLRTSGRFATRSCPWR